MVINNNEPKIPPLEPKQKEILNLLYENSSYSFVDLAQKLRITRQTVAKHIKQIKEQKLFQVTDLETFLDPTPRVFFIEIKSNPEEPEIVSKLLKLDGITSIDGIIGPNSLMVKFIVKSDKEFNTILNRIDGIITGSRFQHYRILDCLHIFKDGGKVIPSREQNTEGHSRSLDITSNRFKTIAIEPEFISKTDFPFKYYLQIMPKNLSEYTTLAYNILAPKMPITELYRTGQEYGLLAVVRTFNIEEFKVFIESLYRTKKIQDTITTLVIDEKMPSIFMPFQ